MKLDKINKINIILDRRKLFFDEQKITSIEVYKKKSCYSIATIRVVSNSCAEMLRKNDGLYALILTSQGKKVLNNPSEAHFRSSAAVVVAVGTPNQCWWYVISL